MAYFLIVDDEPEARNLMQLMLRPFQETYEFQEAANGMEALNIVKETRPELILLDLMMPQMDGHGFLQNIQAYDELTNVPVVIFTALTVEHAGMDAYENPIQYFQKGRVTPQNLRKTIAEILKGMH